MHIVANTVTVDKSVKETFDFLTDVNNFERLMPSGYKKFDVIDTEKFVFALSGMPEIALKLKSKTPYSEVVLESAKDKIYFTLTIQILEVSTHQSSVTLDFKGKFNVTMAMMIKPPITKFMEALSNNLIRVSKDT